MEFKGTKKEWHAVDYAGTYYLLDGEYYEDKNIFDSECVGEEVAKANAHLAVNAQQLLDFITRVSGEMLRNDFVLDEKWYEQAQQLIKKATTL